jgi:hypothetical protein
LPIAAVVGAATSVIARSDCAAVPTFTLVVLKLLNAYGSLVSEFTDAMLVRIVPVETPLFTLVTTENVADDPAARYVATQEMVPAEPSAGVVQLHPEGTTIDWNVVFAGTTEVKKSPAASLAPLLVTCCVQVRTPAAATSVGDAVVVNDKSADDRMLRFAVTLSLSR